MRATSFSAATMRCVFPRKGLRQSADPGKRAGTRQCVCLSSQRNRSAGVDLDGTGPWPTTRNRPRSTCIAIGAGALWAARWKAEANYMLLKEHVLDLTHLGYVHRNGFKILDWDRAPEVTVTNGDFEFRLDFPQYRWPFLFAATTDFGDRPVARINWGAASPAPQLIRATGARRLPRPPSGRAGLHRSRAPPRAAQHRRISRHACDDADKCDAHSLLLDDGMNSRTDRTAD